MINLSRAAACPPADRINRSSQPFSPHCRHASAGTVLAHLAEMLDNGAGVAVVAQNRGERLKRTRFTPARA